MELLPLKKNTVALVTLALIAALGIAVRTFIEIPIVPGLLVLTPGFLFSLLGGVLGGIPGGVIVGGITGIGGAMTGNEPPLLPFLGNVALGIGAGMAIHIVKERDNIRYVLLVILGGGLIGGLLPSLTIFASVLDPPEVIIGLALIDMTQAILWGLVALIVERTIIRPIVGSYIYREKEQELLELTGQEVESSD
ncbi:MAG: hypothetical protein JSW61_01725 [Candidatus Thorarchaeota archaeon]|nr:MAG: hypothetical protein JSW61_01725 [Candidatus Thorarchaeota archaeon]